MKTSTPTPTPRTEVKSCGELSCDECNARTAALMVERDHWQKIAVSASHEREHNANVAQAMTAERDQLRADRAYNHECINRLASATGTLGENSEKVVDVVLSTIDQLRAELSDQAARFHDEIVSRQGTVRANQELDLKELNHFRAELAAEREKVTMLLSDAYALTKNWHDRAERAEAELATERARTKQIATALTDAISTYFGADKLVTAERIEAWQAALKEGTE